MLSLKLGIKYSISQEQFIKQNKLTQHVAFTEKLLYLPLTPQQHS